MVFVISIILHEFGHYSMVKHLGAKPNVTFEGMNPVVSSNDKLKKDEWQLVLAWGVIYGLIPITIAAFIVSMGWWLLLVAIYILGCKYDLVEINKIQEEKVNDKKGKRKRKVKPKSKKNNGINK